MNNTFTIFGATIHWYGVIIALGMLSGILVASYQAKRRALNSDDIFTLSLIVIPFAVIGARILFVLSNLGAYDSLLDMISVWNGGMSILGGVMGGAIGVLAFAFWKNKDFLSIADIAVPALILGQAIGRWGNFVNQEVYGKLITNPAWQWFPFGVLISGQWFHALFFYESMLNLLGFALLFILLQKTNIKGVVMSAYLMYYGLVRFIMEPMREGEFIMRVLGLPISQVLSAVMFLLGLGITILLILRNRDKSKLQQTKV